MDKIDFQKLKQTFLDVLANRDKYQALKRIDEFSVDGEYVGDMFNYTIFENNGDSPPTFYQINSPYDVVSKKDPQRALVFTGGELVQNIDFTPYVKVRTGLLDAILLELVIDDIKAKKIFMFGSGKVAKNSVSAMNQILGLRMISYANTHGRDEEFETHARDNNIEANFSEFERGDWDIVIMHTPGNTPLITKDQVESMKPGSLLMTYADGMEIDPECYDRSKANLIIDFADNIDLAKDTKKAIESGICTPEDFTVLIDVLAMGNKLELDNSKYTIFRSKGTPYQNIAMLKLLSS